MSTFLNIFTPFYTWCTKLGERLNVQDKFFDYYKDYFQDKSVCMNVFLIAILVSLIVSVLYYLCCHTSFAAAKRYIWGIVLGLNFILIMAITPYYIVGKYDETGLYAGDKHTLLFNSAKTTMEGKLSLVEDDDYRSKITQTAEDFAQKFKATSKIKTTAIGMFTMEEKIPVQMSLMNAIYGTIFFFLFSLIFKRFTTHGKAIPF